MMAALLFQLAVTLFLQPMQGSVRGAVVVHHPVQQHLPAIAVRDAVVAPDAATAPTLSAAAALVWDPVTHTVLYAKNADAPRALASVTKLMTVLLVVERNPDFTKTLTLGAQDNDPEGSRLFLGNGAVVSVQDLFYATLVESANNATEALVRSTGMSETAFVQLMNTRAAQLGMAHTHFSDVTGLGAENVSTASDLVLLADTAFAQQKVRDATTTARYVVTDQATGKTVTVHNTDIFVGSKVRVVAGKTGFTAAAHGNLVSRVKGVGEHELLFIALGSTDQTARFTDVHALADWAFANTQWRTL